MYYWPKLDALYHAIEQRSVCVIASLHASVLETARC